MDIQSDVIVIYQEIPEDTLVLTGPVTCGEEDLLRMFHGYTIGSDKLHTREIEEQLFQLLERMRSQTVPITLGDPFVITPGARVYVISFLL